MSCLVVRTLSAQTCLFISRNVVVLERTFIWGRFHRLSPLQKPVLFSQVDMRYPLDRIWVNSSWEYCISVCEVLVHFSFNANQQLSKTLHCCSRTIVLLIVFVISFFLARQLFVFYLLNLVLNVVLRFLFFSLGINSLNVFSLINTFSFRIINVTQWSSNLSPGHFYFSSRDNLRSVLGFICGLGSFKVGDHLRYCTVQLASESELKDYESRHTSEMKITVRQFILEPAQGHPTRI